MPSTSSCAASTAATPPPPNKLASPAPPRYRFPPQGTRNTAPAPITGESAQHGKDDSIDAPPEDDTRPAAAAGFGFYDEYQEADK